MVSRLAGGFALWRRWKSMKGPQPSTPSGPCVSRELKERFWKSDSWCFTLRPSTALRMKPQVLSIPPLPDVTWPRPISPALAPISPPLIPFSQVWAVSGIGQAYSYLRSLQGWCHFHNQSYHFFQEGLNIDNRWTVSAHPQALSCSFNADWSDFILFIWWFIWILSSMRAGTWSLHFWIPNVSTW